jgi:integrase
VNGASPGPACGNVARHSVANLADRFLDQYPYSAQSKATLSHNLKHPRKAFGDVLVRELRAETIGTWLARLTLAPTTRRHVLSGLRQALDAGVDWGYLDANPAASAKAPSSRTDDKHPFESWAEIYAVADAIAAEYRSLVIFACATGLRPQEWLAIEWRDVDTKARTARVLRTVQDGEVVELTAKTKGSLRTVQLQQPAIDALEALPTPLRGGLIFPAEDGERIDLHAWRRDVWTAALTKAKLEYRAPKQMRQTFATLALAAGAELAWVSGQLGHTSVRTTLDHYARFLPIVDERNVTLLDTFAAASETGGRKMDAIAAEEEAR